MHINNRRFAIVYRLRVQLTLTSLFLFLVTDYSPCKNEMSRLLTIGKVWPFQCVEQSVIVWHRWFDCVGVGVDGANVCVLCHFVFLFSRFTLDEELLSFCSAFISLLHILVDIFSFTSNCPIGRNAHVVFTIFVEKMTWHFERTFDLSLCWTQIRYHFAKCNAIVSRMLAIIWQNDDASK